MKFKNLRQMEDQMLTLIAKELGPDVNINPGSNVNALAEDVAMLLLDVYYEMDSLRYKYNIEEKDLLPMIAVLSRGELIPVRTIRRAHGDRK